MKKVSILVVLSFLVAIVSRGQNESFLQEGKVWNMRYNNPFTGEAYNTLLTIKGDTTVNGHLCKKVYEGSDSHAKAFLFENGQKVFRCWLGREEPELLYDFGCEVGDILALSYCNILVTKIDTVEQYGQLL